MTTQATASPYRLLSIAEAAKVYSERTGQPCSERQMRRWANRNARGRRKLPFAVCRLSERLMITEAALIESAVAPFQQALADWRKGRR
jgi:hypothetical protein